MSINSYKVVMLISHIPLLLRLIEVFKVKENNILELELSFKISGKEIITIENNNTLSSNFIINVEYIRCRIY
ncbi:hypothetical protein [Clostridium botulinum]|uniref:hypothetical protein n=1 Tax=Clostridium botulinum TaxID=1491 RepID=UPI001F3A2865|nr:hypothetical protein [Clostridium botulinum]MCS4471845.1 hypothetical protein [Clostridium botulinum]MCS4473205.1 hypothetical protein [Clostridium botulinum]